MFVMTQICFEYINPGFAFSFSQALYKMTVLNKFTDGEARNLDSAVIFYLFV